MLLIQALCQFLVFPAARCMWGPSHCLRLAHGNTSIVSVMALCVSVSAWSPVLCKREQRSGGTVILGSLAQTRQQSQSSMHMVMGQTQCSECSDCCCGELI